MDPSVGQKYIPVRVDVIVAIRRQARKTVTVVVKNRAESARGGKRERNTRTRRNGGKTQSIANALNQKIPKTKNGLKEGSRLRSAIGRVFLVTTGLINR
jgi:hypothetical protein